MKKNTSKAIKELDTTLKQALTKLQSKRLNDICHYLPVPTGGYMHHFTLKKMRSEQPEILKKSIQRYIIDAKNPKKVLPKKRAARGSRKGNNVIAFTQEDLSKVLEFARQAGDQDMLAKLTPKRSLPAIKKDLIASIRQGKIRQDLWDQYVKLTDTEVSKQEIVQTLVVD